MWHHIICDWSSQGVLWRELSAAYRDLIQGKSPALPLLPLQYGDYAAWQKQQMTGGAYANDLKYWEETLRDAPDLLELPGDWPRPAAITYRGARKRFHIGSAQAQTLRERSRQEKISLFTLFATALNTLLYRYTGSEDILFGVPLADRDRPELQSMIGFLLHVHVLRTRLSGDLTFRELAARVQHGVLDLYDHRSPSFDQIVNRVRPERNVSHSPLVQVIFNWHDRHQQSSFIGLEGLAVESLLAETRTAKFDLTFIVTDDGDDIGIEMEYNTDLFDEACITRMAGHYRTLLEAAAANPDNRIAQLPLLTESERAEILVTWNQTEMAYPRERGVHELLEERALQSPETVAVTTRGTSLTYRQLNERANQLAHYLRELGVGPDSPVGICMERSAEMIVGLLGILKAGGAYVPLDPAYPAERLAFMLNDAGAKILMTQERLGLGPRIVNPACKILFIDTESKKIAAHPTKNPEVKVRPDNLAYIIYTSGSTGEPKGVELTHGGLLNLVFWHRQTYEVTPSDKATQLAGVGFDASVWELWPYLTAGASVHLPDEEARLSPEKLRDWLVKKEITLSFVPTPLAEALVGLEWPASVALRAMLTGGDRLTRHVPPTLPFKLVNHYGPTENTVVTTCAIVGVDGQTAKAPSIGRPIANTRVYLLDQCLQPVPIGVPGELYIGGDGLARGYLKRPELTTERFIANPLNGQSSSRLYRTGDLARYLPNGDLEFIGRNDDQVKIRGFRIELGEIEAVLTEHPGIGSAVVVARDNGSGEKRLVAYITQETPVLDVTELREHLKSKIPDYMVPSAFAVLEHFPLTSNGKVDRAALPDPDDTNLLRNAGAAGPMTEIEKNVAGILASLLKLDQVAVDANFFDLGGHSLLGTQLITRIAASSNHPPSPNWPQRLKISSSRKLRR
jgi:amino acid adenylation domain-containing protein